MTAALVGLVGVVVGVLLGGGVQVVVARLDRRAAARSAARLVYGDPILALSAIRTMAALEFWWSDEAAPPLEDWRHLRQALAGSLSGPDFQTVDGAFYRVAGLETWRKAGLKPEDQVDDARAAAEQLQRAGRILLDTGFRGKEREAMEREMRHYHHDPWADEDENRNVSDA
jgi:hypothetical protein